METYSVTPSEVKEAQWALEQICYCSKLSQVSTDMVSTSLYEGERPW